MQPWVILNSDVLSCNTRVFVLVFSLALTLRKPLLELCKTEHLSKRAPRHQWKKERKKKKSIRWGLIFSFILFFAFLSIYKWKKGLQRSHTAWLVFFLTCLFNFFLFFMLLSDAKRDVLRFATGAFACAAGRSESLESDWKDLFPALFQLRLAWRRGPSPVGGGGEGRVEGAAGTKEHRHLVRREPFFWRLAPRNSDFETCTFRSSSSVLAASARGFSPLPHYIQHQWSLTHFGKQQSAAEPLCWESPAANNIYSVINARV